MEEPDLSHARLSDTVLKGADLRGADLGGHARHSIYHRNCAHGIGHGVTLLNEHHLWAHLLREGVLFCPYPEPYLLLSSKADTETLLLVQPIPYLAGHLLDKYADVHGEDKITMLDDGGHR
mgnify:CR=1 FL=1